MHAGFYVCVRAYLRKYVCTYVCIRVCMYVCMHARTLYLNDPQNPAEYPKTERLMRDLQKASALLWNQVANIPLESSALAGVAHGLRGQYQVPKEPNMA